MMGCTYTVSLSVRINNFSAMTFTCGKQRYLGELSGTNLSKTKLANSEVFNRRRHFVRIGFSAFSKKIIL